MDGLISPALIATTVRTTAPMLATFFRGSELNQGLVECASKALSKAIRKQLESSVDVTTAIMSRLGQPNTCLDLFAPSDPNFQLPKDISAWKESFSKYLEKLNIIDADQIDEVKLSDDFAEDFYDEIVLSARKSNQVLSSFLTYTSSAFHRSSLDNIVSLGQSDAVSTNLALHSTASQFHGRAELISRITQAMAINTRPIVLFGISGSGKSSIAHKISTAGSFDLVWWFRASDNLAFDEDCSSVILNLGFIPSKNPIRQLREILAKRSNWLIVLDDVKDYKAIEVVIPAGEMTGSVLITSNYNGDYPSSNCIQIPSLVDVEGGNFLRQYLNHPLGELTKISSVLGGLPLALRQAGTYIRNSGISSNEFIDRVNRNPMAVLDNNAPVDHPNSVAATHEMALEYVISRVEFAAEVLNAVAICQATGVPRMILSAIIPGDVNGVELDEALSELSRASLIQVDSDGLVTCHALTSRIALDSIDNSNLRLLSAALLIAIRKTLQLEQQTRGISVESLLPTAELLMTIAHAGPVSDIDIHLGLAMLASKIGRAATAESQIEKADQLIFDAPINMVAILNQKISFTRGLCQALSGHPEQAIQTLSGIVSASNPEPEMAVVETCYLMMASCADQIGDTPRAIEYLDCVIEESTDNLSNLQLFRTVLSSKLMTPVAATVEMEKLANLHRGSGSILEAWLSVEIARAMRTSSRPLEALVLLNHALEIDKQCTGHNSLPVGRDLNDIGMTLLALGQLDEAEVALEESLQIYSQQDGLLHIHGGMPALHLGRLFVSRGTAADESGSRIEHLRKAEIYLEKAKVLNSVAGPANSDLSATFIAIADLRIVQEQIHEAASYQAKALRIDRDIYGDSHYESALDAIKLAGSQIIIGNLVRAAQWIEFAGHVFDNDITSHPAESALVLFTRLQMAHVHADHDGCEEYLNRIRNVGLKFDAAKPNMNVAEKYWKVVHN